MASVRFIGKSYTITTEIAPLAPRRLERGDVVGRADGAAGRTVGDALDEAGEHFAGAGFVETVGAGLRHGGDRLAPAHGAGDLRHQRAHDLGGILDRLR